MGRKVCLLTGATGSIGKSIAKKILDHMDYELILLVRNEKKGKDLVAELKKNSKNKEVTYEIVDLSLKKSIADLRKRWNEEKHIHCLINNAALVPQTRTETQEGIELSWAVNVLGYVHIINYFKDIIIKSSKNEDPARIINVASHYAGNLNLDDVEFKQRKFDATTAYKRSKQANRMLSCIFAEELKSIFVASLHPGVVTSSVLSGLGFSRGYDTADEGAELPTWLALNKWNKDFGFKESGNFFSEIGKSEKCKFCKKKDLEKLKEVLKRY